MTEQRTIRSSRLQGALALATFSLAVAGGAGLYVVGQSGHVVTVDDAVERFRAAAEAPSKVAEVPAATQVDQPSATSLAAAASTPEASRSSGAVRRGSSGSSANAVASRAPGSAAQPGTPAAAALPTPRNGVYTYATTGREEVSALGGASHTYPATTTMSVTGGGCSQVVRWDALEERYDELGLCAAGQGIRATSYVTYHEFFGQVDKKSYTCDAATMLRPDSRQAGASSTGSCVAPGAKAVVTSRIIGLETVRVGDLDVPAVKVQVNEVLTGASEGSRLTESWYALADNLLLKRTADTDADSDSAIGRTHYVEHYTLHLMSLTPRT